MHLSSRVYVFLLSHEEIPWLSVLAGYPEKQSLSHFLSSNSINVK